MALNLEQKKAQVAGLAEVAANAHSAVAAEYRGLTVTELNELRVEARNAGVYLRVMKNSLVRRAVEDTQFACMREHLVGPLIFAFAREDPGAAARVASAFAKQYRQFEVKLVAVGGQLLESSDLEKLAKMPNRDQAFAMLMAVMKAPIEKLARTLAEPHAKLARTLAALRGQKQAG